ncbi:unannotated protein [freshwater metagenome]|uniref:Unannotated protein n=1 Tax=freshwater metagenome TaxID=449393 RepID=A0A6J7NUU6_9ZZZZ
MASVRPKFGVAVMVPRTSLMVLSQPNGFFAKSNGLSMNRSAPATNASSAMPTSPRSWNNGSHETKVSETSISMRSSADDVLASTFALVSATSLGAPVEPLVDWRCTMSSGAVGAAGGGSVGSSSARSRAATRNESGRMSAGTSASLCTNVSAPPGTCARSAPRFSAMRSRLSNPGREANSSGRAPCSTQPMYAVRADSGDGHATTTLSPGSTPESAKISCNAAARRTKSRWVCLFRRARASAKPIVLRPSPCAMSVNTARMSRSRNETDGCAPDCRPEPVHVRSDGTICTLPCQLSSYGDSRCTQWPVVTTVMQVPRWVG